MVRARPAFPGPPPAHGPGAPPAPSGPPPPGPSRGGALPAAGPERTAGPGGGHSGGTRVK
ncbi:hypothetical protein GCM10017778_20110 [Streptomyces vinaceus]|nr:hypothetical protein GCM10017778_20110 [Streptomyces vinaceus]